MKLCPFCAEEIQDAAIVCKHCGRELTAGVAVPALATQTQSPPVKKSSLLGTVSALLGIGILGSIFIGAVLTDLGGGPSAPANNGTARPTNGMAVSARELYSAYHDNEVQADERYKGQILEVTGTVDEIKKDFLDQPYLMLSVGQDFAGVHATFPRGTNSTVLSSLQKSQTVTVQCRGKGMIIGDPVLDDCSLQDAR